MEVLKPAEPVVQQVTQRTDVPKELVDAGLTMKNVEILNHLGSPASSTPLLSLMGVGA